MLRSYNSHYSPHCTRSSGDNVFFSGQLLHLHHLLQVSYFNQTYPDKGIPDEVLTEVLSEAMDVQTETSVS